MAIEGLPRSTVRGATHIGTEAEPDNAKIDDLIELMEIDPEALREAEFFQVQSILDTLVGKSIAAARMEDTRIVVETAEGDRYFFYGFMGSGRGANDRQAS